MSDREHRPDFEYDGQLVFNGLYQTNVLDPDFDLSEIVKKELKDYKRGTADSPASGYGLLDFGDLATQDPFLNNNLQERVSNVRAIRHQYEDWEERELPSGERQDTFELRSYDLYWDFPDFMYVKGDKTQATRASEIVEYKLGNYVDSREIEFDPDFLLWIFSKNMNNENLEEHIDARLLSDAYVEGEEDRYGKEVSVDRSTDITKSTSILSGILRNKDLIGLEGTFGVREDFVKANIQVGGRVHLKIAYDIDEADDLERMSVSLSFLRELLTLYTEWETFDPTEKYPPLEFFETVYEECKRQGEEPTFSWDHVVEQYRDKRAGKRSAARQSGLSDFGENKGDTRTDGG